MNLRARVRRDAGNNLIQTAFLQLTGLGTFFITSRYLDKNDYGVLNWALALCATFTALCGLGLDQALVHRISEPAASPRQLFSLHLFHTLLAGFILLAGGTLWIAFYPGFQAAHPGFLIVFLSVLAVYLANSLRLALTGMSRFRNVAAISIGGNAVKLLGIPALWLTGNLTVLNIAVVWLGSGVAEVGVAVWVGLRMPELGIRPRFDRPLYRQMLRASLPLFFALAFDTVLAKIDWILMGLFASRSATADYVFAYKMFELAKLPLLVASPLFLPYLTRLLHAKNSGEAQELPRFLKQLMFVAVLIPLVVLICWSPVIGSLTKGKYGVSNYRSFLFLAACVPLHYITNFYYFKSTALNRYKTILWITALVSVVNLGLNLLLIPRFAGPGAGAAFLLATLLQTGLYLTVVRAADMPLSARIFLLPPLFGVLAFVSGAWLQTTPAALAVTLAVYGMLSIAGGFSPVTLRLPRRP